MISIQNNLSTHSICWAKREASCTSIMTDNVTFLLIIIKKSTSVRYEISLSYAQPASNELSLVAYKHGVQNVCIYITKYKRKKLI